jgi:teichuronic acid biosynthesis glycosyltransferase TuaG
MRLVSVIIPYFKKRKFFYKTINSVINQTYKKTEIIIIYDDIDQTDLNFFKKKFKDLKNIKFLINKKNIGAGLSRNKGIKYAKGYYIAFLDSDDYWAKNKLKIQIEFMEKNNISISNTSYRIVDKNSKLIGYRNVKKKLLFEDLIKSCDIGLSTIVIKKKVISNKFFFPNLKTKEDYVLWLTLAKKKFIFYGIKKYLVNWRKLDNSLSSSNFQKIIDGYRVYYSFMNYNFLKSFVYLLRLSIKFLIKRIN